MVPPQLILTRSHSISRFFSVLRKRHQDVDRIPQATPIRFVFGRAGVSRIQSVSYIPSYSSRSSTLRAAAIRVRSARLRIAADLFLTTHNWQDWDSHHGVPAQSRSWNGSTHAARTYNTGKIVLGVVRARRRRPRLRAATRARAPLATGRISGLWPASGRGNATVCRFGSARAGGDEEHPRHDRSARRMRYSIESGDASNGINKLYAQLLAAKLNIANGANGSAVLQTITQADRLPRVACGRTDWSCVLVRPAAAGAHVDRNGR